MPDEKPTDEQTAAVAAVLTSGIERMAVALEYAALAAWTNSQHQKCNHKGCKNGATRLALSLDKTAVVPVCAKHDEPEFPDIPAKLAR